MSAKSKPKEIWVNEKGRTYPRKAPGYKLYRQVIPNTVAISLEDLAMAWDEILLLGEESREPLVLNSYDCAYFENICERLGL